MYEDDYDEDGTNLVKQLRKQLKEKDLKISELSEVNEKLSTQTKTRSVQEVLTSKGVNPKLAKFALADGAEDEESVEKWLAENGELFGVKAQAETAPAVDDDDLAAMRAIQDATATGGAAANDRLAQQTRILDEADTPEAWMTAMKALKAGQSPE